MIHTNHISTTPASTSDFSSAIDRGTVPRAKSEEKSEVLAGVVEIMLTVNYSHSGEVLRLLGTSPYGVTRRYAYGSHGEVRRPGVEPAIGAKPLTSARQSWVPPALRRAVVAARDNPRSLHRVTRRWHAASEHS